MPRQQERFRRRPGRQPQGPSSQVARRQQAALARTREASTRSRDVARRAAQQRASQTRRVKHTVKKGEGIEAIATQYGLTAQDTLQQAGVERLRAGQVLSLDAVSEEPVPRADLSGLRAGPQTDRATSLAEFGETLRQPAPDLFGNQFGLGAPTADFGGVETDPITGELGPASQPSRFAPPAELEDTRRFRGRGTPPGLTAARQAEATERGNFGVAMRYTYSALQEVWNTGDRNSLPSFLTDFMLSQFTQDQQEKIIGMGYFQVEPGVWVPQDVEEADYGMGGWEYPGYGGGFGGGGYEEKYFTKGGSSYRGGATGGRTRVVAGRLFAGNVDRASWRI